MARRIEVEFVAPSAAYVRGHGSRELLTELRGRAPVFGTIARAWVTQPHVARDLIAIAENRGYAVEITEVPIATEPISSTAEEPISSGGLW